MGRVFVCTANDYLAHRDADQLSRIYADLGLTCGAISSEMSDSGRREAYRSRVVYGTMREFGFDYLRDRLLMRDRPAAECIQAKADVLIVDEADSLLIDEARTPLIISGPGGRLSPASEACYRWCATVAPDFQESKHYVRVGDAGSIAFTTAGRREIYKLEMPTSIRSLTLLHIIHALERSIYVNHTFQRDVHYLVKDQKVVIVDEYTGRISEGRSWSEGFHQAIEARENLPFTKETSAKAQITIQDYVSRFKHISGMTGTASESRREFQGVYGLRVKSIPTHQPSRRSILPPKVYSTRESKWKGVLEETLQRTDAGRAVLIGTRTIQQTQDLERVFSAADIPVYTLNATNPESEAEIIARAGESQRVTIATNMAGRGTDIKLAETVRAAGGLHVIATELHAASRIDRQLAGRCARCGDPGSFQQMMSLDDEILVQAYGVDKTQQLRMRYDSRLPSPRLFMRAQRIVQARHQKERSMLAKKHAHLSSLYQLLGLDPVLDRVIRSDQGI